MIRKIHSTSLHRLYESGDPSGIPARSVAAFEEILTVLDTARVPADVGISGYRLRATHSEHDDAWSVRVSGEWPVTFRFEGSDVTDVLCAGLP